MSDTIDIQANQYNIDESKLKQAARAVLDHHNIAPESGLSIVFTDNATVQGLNLQYRNLDAPTDILSFPAEPLPEYIADELPYLGDLIIAYPYTRHNIEKQKVDLTQTFCLLVIHGTLHLLGYDHTTEDEQAEMWAAQADALKSLEINPNIVSQYGKIRDD